MLVRGIRNRTLVLALAAIIVLALAALAASVWLGWPFSGLAARDNDTTQSSAARVPVPKAGDWPAFMYDGARTGYNPTETLLSPANAKDLKLAWRQKLGEGSVLAAQPIVYSSTLYVGSWDGFLYALNTADGSLRWKKDLGRTSSKLCAPSEAGITSAPHITQDGIYIGGGDDKLYKLDPNTGETIWTFKTGDNSETGGAYNWASPLVYGDRVYFGIASFCDRPFTNGRMWGIDAATGTLEQEVLFVPAEQRGGGIWTSPTVDEATGEWYVTTGSGDFYIPHSYSLARLDPQTLAVVDAWQIPLAVQVFDGDWGTTPTLFKHSDGRLLVGAAAKNGYFYTFDAHNIGSGPLWSVQIADGGSCPQCGEGALSTNAYAYDTLYVAAGYLSLGQVQKFPGTLTALDPSTGAIKWMHPTSGWVIPALAAANGLVIATPEDTVEVVDAATGQLLWEYATGGVLYAAPTISGGTIFVASTDGYVYAFNTGAPPSSAATPYPVGMVGANPPHFTPFRSPIPAQPLVGEQQCFEETGKCVRAAFLDFWREQGGLQRFGPAVTDELNEAGRTVQYFRNAYLQIYDQGDGKQAVRTGRLDFRLFYPTPKDERFDRAEPTSGATYVPETGHNLAEPFLSFWRANGEVAGLGYPVSEPLTEFNVLELTSYRVQYFERARLEIVRGADGKESVRLGALGLQRYLQRYGTLP